MSFNYRYVFVVVDDNKEIKGIFIKKEHAEEILPDSKKRYPEQLPSRGDWQYGKAGHWKILQRKVGDSAGIPS